MTVYCLIGANGRVLDEIESEKTVPELWYEFADGTRIAGVLPKDKLPPDINKEPIGMPNPYAECAGGCSGYEEGVPLDKVLSATHEHPAQTG